MPRTLRIPRPYIDEETDARKFPPWLNYGIDNLGRVWLVTSLWHPGFWREWWTMWKGRRLRALCWYWSHRKDLVFEDCGLVESIARARASVADELSEELGRWG